MIIYFDTYVVRPPLEIESVICQPDRGITIVKWNDGDTQVLQCGEDEVYSAEFGIAMAISKKFMGGYTPIREALENAQFQFPDRR